MKGLAGTLTGPKLLEEVQNTLSRSSNSSATEGSLNDTNLTLIPKGTNEDDEGDGLTRASSNSSWSIPRNLILVYSGQNFLDAENNPDAATWPKGQYYLAQNVRRMIAMHDGYHVEFFYGEKCRSLINEFEEILPGVTDLHRIWNATEVLTIYEHLAPQYQSDFCRIMALWKLGGVYVDNDTFFVKKDFFRFFDMSTTFFTSTTGYAKNWLLCGFVGGTTKNELILLWLELTLLAYIDEKDGTEKLKAHVAKYGIPESEVDLTGSPACKLLSFAESHEHNLLRVVPSPPPDELNNPSTTNNKKEVKVIWHEGRFDEDIDVSADRGSYEQNPWAIGPASSQSPPGGPIIREQVVAFTRFNNVLNMRNEAISESGIKEILSF